MKTQNRPSPLKSIFYGLIAAIGAIVSVVVIFGVVSFLAK